MKFNFNFHFDFELLPGLPGGAVQQGYKENAGDYYKPSYGGNDDDNDDDNDEPSYGENEEPNPGYEKPTKAPYKPTKKAIQTAKNNHLHHHHNHHHYNKEVQATKDNLQTDFVQTNDGAVQDENDVQDDAEAVRDEVHHQEAGLHHQEAVHHPLRWKQLRDRHVHALGQVPMDKQPDGRLRRQRGQVQLEVLPRVRRGLLQPRLQRRVQVAGREAADPEVHAEAGAARAAVPEEVRKNVHRLRQPLDSRPDRRRAALRAARLQRRRHGAQVPLQDGRALRQVAQETLQQRIPSPLRSAFDQNAALALLQRRIAAGPRRIHSLGSTSTIQPEQTLRRTHQGPIHHKENLPDEEAVHDESALQDNSLSAIHEASQLQRQQRDSERVRRVPGTSHDPDRRVLPVDQGRLFGTPRLSRN